MPHALQAGMMNTTLQAKRDQAAQDVIKALRRYSRARKTGSATARCNALIAYSDAVKAWSQLVNPDGLSLSNAVERFGHPGV